MTIGQVVAIGVALGLSRRRVVIPFANAPMVVLTGAAVVVILVSTVGGSGVILRLAAGAVFAGVLVMDGSLAGARQLLIGRRS